MRQPEYQQSLGTVSTQVPMRLSACPDTYRRKFATASAANIAEDAEGRPRRVIVAQTARRRRCTGRWRTEVMGHGKQFFRSR